LVRQILLLALACGVGCARQAAAAPDGPQQQPAAASGSASTPSTANPIDYATARLERVMHAKRITGRINIDGRLDEPEWEGAQMATDFIQWEPNPGQPATDRTEARFLYDANKLYVGIRAFDDRPDEIVVSELKKDFEANDGDTVGVFIDSLHDRQSGFSFQTNPAGARRDVQVSRDGDQINMDWDGVWEVKTTRDEKGWTAEFEFPFKTLRFADASEQEWGLNLLRRVRHRNQDSMWSPLPRRYRFNRASMAGTLRGLEGIRQGRNLKVKPYAIGSSVTSGANGRKLDGNGGVDVKYGITQSMTLDLTYRTDFSQVEADQEQINLTRFNLLFPEKREFFLENANLFSVAGTVGGGQQNVIPFFSRRVGLSPAGTPIPIVGGTRVSGRTGTYDVGLIAMRADSEGETPANTFLAGRLRKNFRNTSSIGAIMTSRDSALARDHNRLLGFDTFVRLSDRLEVTSYWMFTETPERTGRNEARLLSGAWRDNDLTLRAQYEQAQANFNPEAGFVRRPSETHRSAQAIWRPRPADNRRIRNYILEIESDFYVDDKGEPTTREHRGLTGITFQNGSTVSAQLTNTFESLVEPFAIRPTVVLPTGDYSYQRYQVNLTTDRSRLISANVNANTGSFWNGTNTAFGGTVEFKPSFHLNVDVNFSYNRVDLIEGEFTTPLIGTRVVWGFNSKAFINSFLQYNATTHQFSANTRFNILHRPLSDLFVVYNERRNTVTDALLDRGIVVKFTNMFDF
jgi:hypothetical protein